MERPLNDHWANTEVSLSDDSRTTERPLITPFQVSLKKKNSCTTYCLYLLIETKSISRLDINENPTSWINNWTSYLLLKRGPPIVTQSYCIPIPVPFRLTVPPSYYVPVPLCPPSHCRLGLGTGAQWYRGARGRGDNGTYRDGLVNDTHLFMSEEDWKKMEMRKQVVVGEASKTCN